MNSNFFCFVFNPLDYRKLSFDATNENVVNFLKRFERCFDKNNDECVMKFALIDFIPLVDRPELCKFINENSYKLVKKKLIERYIPLFTRQRALDLDIKFDPSQVHLFIDTKIKMLKKYSLLNENEIVESILSSLPPAVADRFYIYDKCESLDDLISFSKILDLVRPPTTSTTRSSTISLTTSSTTSMTTSTTNLNSDSSATLPSFLVDLARFKRPDTAANNKSPKRKIDETTTALPTKGYKFFSSKNQK